MSLARNTTITRALGGAASLGIALACAALLPGTASAAPVECTTAPSGAAETGLAGASQCDSTADATSAAAGYGFEGWGSATALSNAAALALGFGGGTAVSDATFGAGPAAISFGPGSVATNEAIGPGLSIAIAGPGSVVTLTPTGAVCNGPGIAGSFTTLQGCIG
ncbi:hypothetical protein HQ346_21030 [Rhodococcus sp. BP-252]|uniref:DUF6764 family protein n=1 Tax=unclassified Rhodococcus (in: high G+C Gram-positive bacteria) TaxID=192944 RepID=UPI000DF29298|nr:MULTISPECIES: DUF6764 family protein [unclassified Rhodococcus (in: high G+C Gram-positive bacteria)]MBY6414183.1 hypothetical protein [Rhodococcus sp. BP-320]MBY6418953.1 hypothetical protein [Rhodococcus sp. BP-321]MBY6423706.1 hypothetical protein [Rhodococcus sp. BP-324]MBY6428988.1 hypothetical protein [Rhodococcus sp. BP-323]MBY6433993.1 hypothetical protein [Rhodococcus sp. BP-322]